MPAISLVGQFRQIERIGTVSALPLIATELLCHSELRYSSGVSDYRNVVATIHRDGLGTGKRRECRARSVLCESKFAGRSGQGRFPMLCPRQRQYLSLCTRLAENVPASIAAIAISMASGAVFASMPVTKHLSFLRPASAIGAPSTRQIRARHFPESCSNAWTINRLYSTADLHRTDMPMGRDKAQR